MPLTAASERTASLDHASTHDLRGWQVRTRLDGAELGTVAEVLLDEDGTPRHLEVDLSDDDRHVLVPVGHAALDADERTVVLPGLARDAIGGIPTYEGDPGAIGPEYESTLGVAWDRAYGPDTFYASPHFAADWTAQSGARAPGRAAAPTTGTTREVRVDTLDDVDVAEHDHDPRGWTVVGRDGAAVGRVEHLMGDLQAMKVRYLTVKPEDGGVPDDRRILVPAGHAALEPERERVRIDALDPARLESWPAWGDGPLEHEHERKVTEHLGSGYEGPRRYRHPRYRTEHLRESPASVTERDATTR